MIINKWRPVDHYFPNATVSYYDITGSTAEELRAQLNLLRPADADGDRYDAVYRWYINWNWPGRGHSPCQLDKAIVTCKIWVIFPRWIPPKNASPELVNKWENYIYALSEHEKGHVDYFVNNYQIVANAIKSADCYTGILPPMLLKSSLNSMALNMTLLPIMALPREQGSHRKFVHVFSSPESLA